jgi:hypothetical protein
MSGESAVPRWPAFLLVFVMLITGGPIAAAQETPVPPSGEAGRYLPDPAAFGEGWTAARVAALDVDTDVFRDGAVANMTGPDGARLMLIALLVTQDRVAIRRSWEAAAETNVS